MELIKIICYNFEAEKNKELADIKTKKKAMIWRKSEGSTIVDYNDQFMNRERVAEACGGTFQLPGVTARVLKEKHIGFAISKLESTAKKELKNEVRKMVPAVPFIENANRRM